MKKYVSLFLLVGIVGALFLTGCGPTGVEAEPLGGVPEPPAEAEVLPEEELGGSLEQIEESFQQSQGVSNADVEIYVLPPETPFAEVRDYYGEVVGGWNLLDAEEMELLRAEGLEASVWSNDDTGEILSIQYLAAPEFGGNVLIVIYAEE